MRESRTVGLRFRFGDIVGEALTTLVRRPGRAALFVVGAALGSAIFANSMLLSSASAAQVAKQFDEIRSTRVSVTDPDDAEWLDPGRITATSTLSGVRSIGVTSVTNDQVPLSNSRWDNEESVPAIVGAADTDALQAMGAELVDGRFYDSGAVRRGDPVVVLGASLAASLGHPPANGHTVVWLNGRSLLVVGVVDVAPRGDPNLLLRAFVPSIQLLSGLSLASPTVVVDTAVGMTNDVASILALALRPNGPDDLVVAVPADPQGLRKTIDDQLRLFIVVLSIIAFVIGAVVVGNSALSAIGQRRVEFALRRALGTSRTAICTQVVLETTLCGGAGGLAGVYLGHLVAIVIDVASGWPIRTDIRLLPIGLGMGAISGMIAGLYPAIAAGRMEPAQALRS